MTVEIEVEVEVLVDVRVGLFSEKLSPVDVSAIKMRVDVYFIFDREYFLCCTWISEVVKTANAMVGSNRR